MQMEAKTIAAQARHMDKDIKTCMQKITYVLVISVFIDSLGIEKR